MRRVLFVFAATGALLLCFSTVASAISSNLVIAEVQVGGSGTGTTAQELVAVYNNSDQPIKINDWCVQYSSANDGVNFSNIACFKHANSNVNLWLAPKSYAVVAAAEFILVHPGYSVDALYNGAKISGTSGHIRLVNHDNTEIDRVGYDADNNPATGALRPETNAALFTPSLTGSQSFQRIGDEIKQDTDHNFLDFTQLPLTVLPISGVFEEEVVDVCPNLAGLQTIIPEGYILDQNGNCQEDKANQSSCAGIIINELLVNPDGSDTGKEFIEIYNPIGSIISLAGCQIQTSANNKSYTFGNDNILSGQYIAYYNSETGLTLSNSSNGKVYLVDTNNSEIDYVEYPANLGDNVSWSLFADGWAASYLITPNLDNQLLAIKPCSDGEYRNPSTNRCNSLALEATGLSACGPGQQRNPETNRCRNLASLSSVLKPCAADQFRHPETNRCRKVSANSGLKPCKANQERNPETNRCRNVAGVLGENSDPIQDIQAQGSTTKTWILAASGIIGALLYGLWEWRNEIILNIMTLKKRFSGLGAQ